MKNLWEAALSRKKIQIIDLPIELQACLHNGDGVADHYGGRTNFTFVEQKDDLILVLEKLDDAHAQSWTIVNMTGGYGTGILGSAISELGSKIPSIINSTATTNDEFHSVERLKLCSSIKKMVAAHTCSKEENWGITFTSTGSEAMDLALQIVYLEGQNTYAGTNSRKHKDVILACHGAWHGWSQGPNQLLDRKHLTDGIPRSRGFNFDFLQYGDLNNLRHKFEIHKGRIRAISVEGILGDGGVISASLEWWTELFNLSQKEDARIIDDEILTGFRTGGILAIPSNFSPDCITLGKALGFGLFPISAVIWRSDRLTLRPGLGVRTFNARPFQAAVVNAGIKTIQRNNLFARSAQLGYKLMNDISCLAGQHSSVIKAVRGQGLFIGIELSDSFARRGKLVRDTFIRHGLLSEIESGIFNRDILKSSRVNETIRLTPPLTISEKSLELATVALKSGIEELELLGSATAL